MRQLLLVSLALGALVAAGRGTSIYAQEAAPAPEAAAPDAVPPEEAAVEPAVPAEEGAVPVETAPPPSSGVAVLRVDAGARPIMSTLGPIMALALFLIWVAVGDWVNRDSQIFKLGYQKWNPIIFFPSQWSAWCCSSSRRRIGFARWCCRSPSWRASFPTSSFITAAFSRIKRF